MTMVNFNKLTPLSENEYNEKIFRSDERGYFMSQMYFMDSQKNFYIPAFTIADAADDYYLEFGANADGTECKKFNRHSKYYYDKNLGWNVAGWTYIFICENDTIIETHKILVLPDRLECEAMTKELLSIRRELFQKSNENYSSLAENLREKSWAEILEALNTQSEEIFQLMKKIDARPRFGLQKFQERRQVSKIRRFDDKIIRQYSINPNRKTFQISAEKISMNIFENRLLKSKILRLKEFVEQQSQQQKINAENLANDIKAQKKYIESLEKSRPYDDSDLAKKTLKNLAAQLQANEKNLKTSPNKILELLNKCLSLSVFNEEVEERNEKWRMTQIFTNDANYRRAYLKLKELDEIFDFSFDADEKSFPSEKMYQIYEWWILAKIIDFLVMKLKWQTDGKFAETLRQLFNNAKNINNVPIHLTHENSKMEMDIFYNTSINESLNTTGCILRPDYLFKVTAGETVKFFILDAKYRNYEQQRKKYGFYKDLREICLNKYIQLIKKATGKEISMSFIVHSDKTQISSNFLGKYVLYNGATTDLNGERQQIGAFYLLPETKNKFNQSEINLSLFFKMMFEYFMEKWQICWECGSNDVEKKEFLTGRYKKYHLRCNKCKAFWVKNHCAKCKTTHTMLIKHAINYHVEQDGTWYVCCPKCGG